MLNDRNLNEIGKRMHDLEAEPPTQGWNKISADLKRGPMKEGFIKSNWWKPLILIIPIAVYTGVYHFGEAPQILLMKADISSRTADPNDETTTPPARTEPGAINDIDETPDRDISHSIPALVKQYQPEDGDNNSSETRNSRTVAPAAKQSRNMDRVNVLNLSNETLNIQQENAHQQLQLASTAAPINSNGRDSDSNSMHPSGTQITSGSIEGNMSAINDEGDSLTNENIINSDSGVKIPSNDNNTGAPRETWRLFADFNPDYALRAVRPEHGDEILITKIESGRSLQRIGFNFSIGASKAIRKNLYADFQLGFNQLKENFTYRYTAGRVDTMITEIDHTGLVRVIPVYAEYSAAIRSTLSYGSVKAGATWFFWERGRRRFNLSAAGGFNYLMHANVEKKNAGTWEKVDSDNLEKKMLSLTLSGGYNIMLGRGWEVQLNPSVTYFKGSGSTFQQFLNLNQRSYGAKLTVSKFF